MIDSFINFISGPFLPNFLDALFNFAINPEFSIWLFIIKYIFILIGIAFLALVVIVPLTTGWLKLRYLNNFLEFITFRPIGAVRAEKRWKKIMKRVEEGGTESDYKLSIMEAETMFNDILEEMGYSGDTLEERLEQLGPSALPNRKEVLKAHKIRNSVARDPDYEVDLEKTQEVLNSFEKALTNLQAF